MREEKKNKGVRIVDPKTIIKNNSGICILLNGLSWREFYIENGERLGSEEKERPTDLVLSGERQKTTFYHPFLY